MTIGSKKPLKKIVFLICLALLTVSCTCADGNYSDDHAINVERCLQSLEDGTAYEIDEALTAKAPWKPGSVVKKFRDGEGGYYLREFIGITKAGYYLVQDYQVSGFKTSYPRYNPKVITNQIKMTEPFLLMSRSAVTDDDTWPATTSFMPSACGEFTNYYGLQFNEKFVRIREHGTYLDGAKYGEWRSYNTNGGIWKRETYQDNVRILQPNRQ